jgi:hypothetical protein
MFIGGAIRMTSRHSCQQFFLATIITAFAAPSALAQTTSVGDPGMQGLLSLTPVLNQPFSATRYVRTVTILPDGSQAITAAHSQMKVARDADGRILVDRRPDCPPPGEEVPPWCGTHVVVLFDPGAHTITPWLWGANSGREATTLPFTEKRLEKAIERVTMDRKASDVDSSEASVTTQSMGQEIINGVTATGVRTKTFLPTGSDNYGPVTITRDVWTSAEMKLVMKVVITDPRTGVTTVGFENFSRHPDASLFLPPDGYVQNTNNWPLRHNPNDSYLPERYLKPVWAVLAGQDLDLAWASQTGDDMAVKAGWKT